MLPLVVFASLTADSPLSGSGRSAVEARICSRDDVVSGGSQGGTADGPPLGRGQSAVESRKLSRDVFVSGGLST